MEVSRISLDNSSLFMYFLKILGFSVSGEPILPATAASADPDVIRREKLGWEQISMQAAKIVSFIGVHISVLTFSPETVIRLGRPRALS